MIYDLGIASVQQQTAEMLKVSQQMSTGRRILTPADDPIAAAQALLVSQSQATNEQYTSNASSATSMLQLQESTLTSVGNILQEARVTAIQAGNPGLSVADRASLATALQHNYDELLGLANTNDGNGQYLFSGYQGGTQPFAESAPGTVAYYGDQGQRLMQISASRQIAVSSSGADVFQQIRTGNGTFVTAAATSNTGAGVISPGTVLDSTKWTSSNKDYSIRFAANTNVTATLHAVDVGTIPYGPGVTIAAPDTLTIDVGPGPVSLTVPAATYDTAGGATDIATVMNALIAAEPLLAGQVTASKDAAGHLVLTSTATGANVKLTVGGNLEPTMFGNTSTATGSNGAALASGIVDQSAWDASGKSLSISVAAGAANTFDYTITGTVGGIAFSNKVNYDPATAPQTVHMNGTDLDNSVVPKPLANVGVDLVLSGTPAAGDAYTVTPTAKPSWSYDLIDNTTNTSLVTGASPSSWSSQWRTYTSGQTIGFTNQGSETAFDLGITTSVQGSPAAGDTFTVKASTRQDIFTTLNNLITTLKSSGNNAAITNGLNTALSNISLAQDNVLTIRAAVGSRMSEVDNQTNTNSDLALQYKTTLSGLQDLDVTKAISDLTQKKASLEAAQKTFLAVQGLSLFKLM